MRTSMYSLRKQRNVIVWSAVAAGVLAIFFTSLLGNPSFSAENTTPAPAAPPRPHPTTAPGPLISPTAVPLRSVPTRVPPLSVTGISSVPPDEPIKPSESTDKPRRLTHSPSTGPAVPFLAAAIFGFSVAAASYYIFKTRIFRTPI